MNIFRYFQYLYVISEIFHFLHIAFFPKNVWKWELLKKLSGFTFFALKIKLLKPSLQLFHIHFLGFRQIFFWFTYGTIDVNVT